MLRLVSITMAIAWWAMPALAAPFGLPLAAVVNAQAPQQIADSRSESAKAWATLLLIHDRSVRSLHWRSEAVRDTLTERVTLSRASGEEAFDEVGRWFAKWTTTNKRPGGENRVSASESYFDGRVLRTFKPAANGGLIRPPDAERVAFPSPELFLGRFVDSRARHRLGEMLLAANDLRIHTSPDVPDRAVLTATHNSGYAVWELRVEVDAAHGYAPRRIEVRDSLIGTPIAVATVDRFKQHGGVWIPVEGTARNMKISTRPEVVEKMAALEVALSRHGWVKGSDPSDPAVRKSFHAAVSEVFGLEDVPFEDLVPPMRLEKVEILSINTPLGDDLFTIRFEPGMRYLDIFTRQNQAGELIENPDEEVLHIPENEP